MMWLKLAVPCLLLSISPFCDGYSTLFPADLGLAEEDVPFMPRERDEFDDCHIHYARYARTEAESLDPFEPYPEPRENSHVAAIGVTRKPGDTIEWLCMGTLIWENVVLTTAHCTVLEEGNANPDVVRLGGGYYFPDSAITAADSEHVIERKVSAIVGHPEFDPITGANDIAVVKLDELVRVNPSVAPACVWLYTEIPFSRMESVGRSRLQPVRNGSPKAEIINEVYFQRNKNKCASFGTGVCMERNRTIANECSTAARGDILQRRLVHNFATSPFLIGLLTSHSTGGQCPTLRSYAPVNQYRDWLIEAMQQLETLATRSSFHPVACALRYAHVRPRVEGLLYERIGDVPRFAAGVQGDESRYMTYIVQLAWPQGSANARNDCVATYVDQRTLLTLAECVLPTSPTSVRTKDRYRSESFEIADVVAHPKYSAGSSRNNIAVIKLKSRVEVVPACPWLLPTLPDRVDYTGIGRMNLQNFLGDTNDPSSESIPSFAMPAVTTQPWQLCGNFLANLAARNQSVPEFTEDEHLCFGDEQWQVPDVCSLLKGAPVMRYIVRSGGFVKYLFGLSLAGKFCGLGLPSVAVAIAPHASWLRSVILNPASSALQAGSTKGSSPLIFINPDLKRSDECTDGRGSLGICVPHEECTSTREQLGSGGRVTLCTNGSIICCAWGDIARGQPSQPVNPVQVELDSCEERYQAVREERFLGLQESEDDYGNLASVAEIGWVMSGGKISFPCSGFLITLRTIVTTARCAESNGRKPTVARIGSVGAGQRTNYLLPPIRKVTVHDDYDETNGLHNIALITLSESIVATPFVFPSCLWKNQTHLPAGALLLSLRDNEPRITTHSVHPMYYSECRERLEDSELLDGQICMLRAAPETKFIVSTPCFTTGSIIMWENTTANPEIIDAQHLVALHSHGDCRENDDVLLTIRVSDYYDWIVSNIK